MVGTSISIKMVFMCIVRLIITENCDKKMKNLSFLKIHAKQKIESISSKSAYLYFTL